MFCLIRHCSSNYAPILQNRDTLCAIYIYYLMKLEIIFHKIAYDNQGYRKLFTKGSRCGKF